MRSADQVSRTFIFVPGLFNSDGHVICSIESAAILVNGLLYD